MTLTEFLTARLAEDEYHAKVAQLRGPGPWTHEPADSGLPGAEDMHDSHGDAVAIVRGSYIADYLTRHDPARVLREVEAKRKLIKEVTARSSPEVAQIYLATLAAVYSDHPDYQNDWGV